MISFRYSRDHKMKSRKKSVKVPEGSALSIKIMPKGAFFGRRKDRFGDHGRIVSDMAEYAKNALHTRAPVV